MKKSLIAVAVAAALPAFAQAQTNVQMYGIADLSIGMQDPGGAAKGSGVVSTGGQSTSRFGVRGTEDLGGGLKAMFNIETVVNWDNGNSEANAATFWQRRAVGGLQGGFGEVRLGRDYTVGFSAAGATDIMGYGLYGNWLSFTANGGVYGIQTRASNALWYTSPALGNTKCMAFPAPTECNPFGGGLTITGFYSFGSGTGASESFSDPVASDDAFGAAIVYRGGPMVAQGYYQVLKTLSGTSAVSNKQYGVGLGWNFGMVRVAGNYGVADPNGPNSLTGGKHTGWQLGAGIKVGAGEVIVSYLSQEIDLSAGTDPKGNTWGVAYVHPLSRRTNLYANIGQTRNNDAGAFPLYASGHSIAAGAAVNGVRGDPKGVQFGVRHMF